MKEIVKYHNTLNNFKFGNMTAGEMDIFFSICSKINATQSDEVSMTYKELRELSGITSTSVPELTKRLGNIYERFFNMSYIQNEGTKITNQHLFRRFEIDTEAQTVTMKVDEDLRFLFYQLTSNFTLFELMEYRELKSSYSKNIYRKLKQWRTVGKYEVTMEQLREDLGIPDSYRLTNINDKVFAKIEKELPSCFEDFKMEKIYESAGKKGRPSLKKIRFTFKPEQRVQIEGGKFTCPDCGGMLVEKVLNGNNCWCHPDGASANAKCSNIYNSVDEIMLASAKPVDEPTTEEALENVRKIKEQIRNTFR